MSWMIRRDPNNEMRNMHQEDFSRFIDPAFARFFGTEEGLLRGSWNPTVDIYENQDTIVLEADLPGLKRGDFELSIENYTLTLRGERKFEKKSEGDNYHRVERSYGSFTRIFTLPSTVNVDDVKAEFREGVLNVTLPKREEVRPRQIEVSVMTEAVADNGKIKTAGAK